MSLIRNVWIVFHVLIGTGLLYLIITSYFSWNGLLAETTRELIYLNRLFSSASTRLLEQQGKALEIIEQRLLREKRLKPTAINNAFLNSISRNNSDWAYLKLHTVESSPRMDSHYGQVRDKGGEPSAYQIEAIRRGKLTLGKSHFDASSRGWIVPAYSPVTDSMGRIRALLEAGLRLEELLPEIQPAPDRNPYILSLFSDRIYQSIFISGLDAKTLADVVTTPIDHDKLYKIITALKEQTGYSISDLRDNPDRVIAFRFESIFLPGTHRWASITYLPEFALWSLISIPETELLDEWYGTFTLFSLTLCLVLLAFYYLVRMVAREQKIHGELLIRQIGVDFVTGLYNRQHLRQIEPQWIEERSGFSCWFIDLDHFKYINDTFGHSTGDRLLYLVSRRIRDCFPADSLVCRQGGDEFIVLTRENDLQWVDKDAKSLLNQLAKPFEIDENMYHIGASIGISLFPDDGNDFETLFSAADSAMYEAKKQRNSYCIYTNKLKHEMQQAMVMEQELHKAVDRGEITLEYQPQVNKEGTPCGIEALCRWNSPRLGRVSPDTFISVAERSGLIVSMGHYIIERAIAEISGLARERQREDLRLSINISLFQLQQQRFSRELLATLEAHDFAPQRLTLEITESLFIEDYEYLMPVVETLREKGIRISLDDFGTGYSSLSLLRNLPIDELKIDKSFIAPICETETSQQLVLSILDIARALGMTVVAEGVEQECQARLLRDKGCDCLQGYYFMKPMPISELRSLCNRWESSFPSSHRSDQ